MIKVKDGYAKLVGTTASGSASHILLSNGGVKSVSDFALKSELPDVSKYLPLTGGTLILENGDSFKIKRNKSNSYGSYIAYETNDGMLGRLGMYKENVEVYFGSLTDKSYNILHEGNFNSYAPKLDGTGASGTWNIDISGDADTLDGYHLSDILQIYSATETTSLNLNNLASGTSIKVAYWAYAGSPNVSNLPWNSSAATTWTLPGAYPLQIAKFYNSNDIRLRGYYNNSGWTSWKQLAFIDSNVASATQVMMNYSYNQDVNYPLVFTSRDNIGVAQNASLYIDFSGRPTYNPKSDTLTVGNINMTGDIDIKIGDSDKFVIFDYDGDKTAGASWRVGCLGSGSSNTNYFVIDSGTSDTTKTTWNRVMLLGMNNYDATFAGQLTATKFIGNLNHTLTFSAGAFTAKTYNNGAAVTVNIPTHTSHLTNNSGFLTSRGYIGTTAVLASSAALALTGITTATLSSTLSVGGKIYLTGTTADTAHILFTRTNYNYITFPDGYSLAFGIATGSASTMFRMDKTALFPERTNEVTLGTSSLRWKGIYSINGHFRGSNAYPLVIDSSHATENGLVIRMSGTNKTWVGYTSGTGAYLYTYTGPHKIGVSDSGVGFIDSNTILHSGNSSVSGGGSSWGSSITVKINGTSKTLTIPSNPNTWRGITNTYTGSDLTISVSQYGTNALYNALVNGYASSAGNADTVDSCHKDDFLRRTATLGFLNKFVLEDIPKGVTQVGSIGWTDYQNYPYAGGLWMTLRGTSSLSTALILFPSYSMSSPPILYSSVDGGAWQGGHQLAYTSQIPTTMAWGNITGKPSTFTPSTHYHNYFPENRAVYFRDPNNASWRGGMYWGSAGNEALCFVTVNANTSFRFFTGSDLANWTSSTWQGTPAFEVNKNGAYAPHFYESSDIRYKTIINNLAIKANQLANLPLFDFKWLDNEDLLNTGTSAQAVQELLPYIVSGTDKLTLDYGVLGTIAGITACKELTEQEKEINELKEQIKFLKDEINNLKTNKLWQS